MVCASLFYDGVPQVPPEKGSVSFRAWHHCTQTCLYAKISIFDTGIFHPKCLIRPFIVVPIFNESGISIFAGCKLQIGQ